MTEITEGDLTFRFPTGCQASKYDDWSFYRRQFTGIAGGSKAVDILCIKGDTSWLIEIKDHRQHPHQKLIDIADEMAMKVRDTLAGLAAAAKAANEADQQELARKALATRETLENLKAGPHRILTSLSQQGFSKSRDWWRGFSSVSLADGGSCCTWNNQLRDQDYGQSPLTLHTAAKAQKAGEGN